MQRDPHNQWRARHICNHFHNTLSALDDCCVVPVHAIDVTMMHSVNGSNCECKRREEISCKPLELTVQT